MNIIQQTVNLNLTHDRNNTFLMKTVIIKQTFYIWYLQYKNNIWYLQNIWYWYLQYLQNIWYLQNKNVYQWYIT